MPPSFYTDAAVLSVEEQAVFTEVWVCVGRADEAPESGNYFVTKIVGESLVVVRGYHREVRVLSNVCRHRASQILEGEGTTRQLLCGHHHWSYDLKGGLKRAPLMDSVEGFDASQCGLPQFATGEWMGWIFVNMSGTADSLLPQLAELDEYVAGYHTQEMRTVEVGPKYWPVNWKVLAENFMEGYHLTHTDPERVQTRWGVIAREELHKAGTAMDRYDFAASFNAEDKVRLMSLQEGLNSRFAPSGPLAPLDYEGCTWDFYNYLADRLL